MPGVVDAIREWYRVYKVVDGKPPNEYGLKGSANDRVTLPSLASHFSSSRTIFSNPVWSPLYCFDTKRTLPLRSSKTPTEAISKHRRSTTPSCNELTTKASRLSIKAVNKLKRSKLHRALADFIGCDCRNAAIVVLLSTRSSEIGKLPQSDSGTERDLVIQFAENTHEIS